jgi:hypothetical protein
MIAITKIAIKISAKTVRTERGIRVGEVGNLLDMKAPLGLDRISEIYLMYAILAEKLPTLTSKWNV